jgi:hypothetical protein
MGYQSTPCHLALLVIYRCFVRRVSGLECHTVRRRVPSDTETLQTGLVPMALVHPEEGGSNFLLNTATCVCAITSQQVAVLSSARGPFPFLLQCTHHVSA